MFSKHFSQADFAKFYETLKVANDYMADVDIRNGKIRQPDKAATLIFECDMSSYFDQSLAIPNIKNKLDILRVLLDDGTDVELNMDDEHTHVCYIGSNKTSYKFNQSNPDLFESRYIPDEKFNANVINNLPGENELLHLNADMSSMQKKIKSLTNALSSKELAIDISKNNASVSIISDDKSQTVSVYEEDTSLDINKKYRVLLPTPYMNCGKNIDSISFYKPFKIDNEDSDESAAVTYCVTKFNLNEGNFTVYSLCNTMVYKDESQPVVQNVPPVVEQPVAEQPVVEAQQSTERPGSNICDTSLLDSLEIVM